MSKVFLKKTLVIIALMGAVIGGSQALAATPTVIIPKSVTLNVKTATIGEDGGNQLQLVATVLPENAVDKSIIWTSSNPYAVTVDVYGMATIGVSKGVKGYDVQNTGTSTIFATTKYGGKSAKAVITVSEGTREIQVTAPTLTMKLGQAPFVQKVTFVPSKTKYKEMQWYADDESIATVDSNGAITPKGVGTTYITVEHDSFLGSFGFEIEVNVIPANGTLPTDVQSVQIIRPDSESIKVGSKLTLKTSVFPAKAVNGAVKWKSRDETIATVDTKGVVTGVSEGSAFITASTENGRDDTIYLNVTNLVTSLALIGNDTATLKVGETKQVEVTISAASNENIDWVSSNAGIAVVENGLITAVSPGKTTIKGTTIDGSKKSVSLTVTVPANVTSVQAIFPKAGNSGYLIGNQLKLKSAVVPSNSSDKTVTWVSSDLTVATVTDLGIVTPLKEGESNLTLTSKDGGFTKVVKLRVIDLTAWSRDASFMMMYSQ